MVHTLFSKEKFSTMKNFLNLAMRTFNVNFSQSTVFIEGKNKFESNEILVDYLNKIDYHGFLEEIRKINTLLSQLQLTTDMSYDIVKNYPALCNELENRCNKIDGFMRSYPPYNFKEYDEDISLIETLHKIDCVLIRDGDDQEYYLDEYNVINRDYDPDIHEGIFEINEYLKTYVGVYVGFLQSVYNALTFIESFIEIVISVRTSFPEDSYIAKKLDEHRKDNPLKHSGANCHIESFNYETVTDDAGVSMLCENVEFSDIGSFLYYDFFNGLKHKNYPVKCNNCGRVFLLTGGKFTQYCDSKIKGKSGQTCRSLGARQRYDDKCKSDPIWNTYNKAYKAHYARMMKKKMTKQEFMEWGEYALELKRQVIAEEISYDEYYMLIRK